MLPDPAAPLPRRDAVFAWALRSAASISAGVIVLIVVHVAWGAWPALREHGVARFVADDTWSPTTGAYNLTPMILGTLAATAGAVLLTTPLGIGSAVFLRFYAPPVLAVVFRRVIELLAGIPSVVYGLWGLTAVVPRIAEISPLGQGQSLLAGVLVLSLMTLPTVALAADAAMGTVPPACPLGGAALGMGRRAIVWSLVLPSARGGILTGVMLQTARALGETMAVLMVCGNIVQVPGSLFAPVRTLTANIALEMGYADAGHRSVLYLCGLVLLMIVTLLVVLAGRIDRLGKSEALPG